MIIVPVIDLFDGVVVHAKNGERHKYLPINSELCDTADAVGVIDGILSTYDFQHLYVADLNALEKCGDNSIIIKNIIQTYPQLEVWLDTGKDKLSLYKNEIEYNALRIILSTESIESTTNYKELRNKFNTHNFLLSIDFRAGNVLGLNDLSENTSIWPNDVIILNLDVVGSNEGIKMPLRFKSLSEKYEHNVFYGGGIRNTEDLHNLRNLGVHGALISTALHNKSITEKDLLKLKIN